MIRNSVKSAMVALGVSALTLTAAPAVPAAAATGATVPACDAFQLDVTAGPQEAAAGSRAMSVFLHNSGETCRLPGATDFGLWDAHGPLGWAAHHNDRAKDVIVGHDETAEARLVWSSETGFDDPAAQCWAPSDFLLVDIADATRHRSTSVDAAVRVCGGHFSVASLDVVR